MEIDYIKLLISILNAFIFFLPAYIANMAPVILWRTRWWKVTRVPIDFGIEFFGYRLFGEHKTYFGVLAAILGGAIGGLIMFTILGRDLLGVLLWGGLIGAILGLGAILGDLVKSFFKRRFKIISGHPWFFWDQVDFVIGSWLAFQILLWFNLPVQIFGPLDPSIWTLLIGLIITPFLHLFSNIVAFKLGWKKVWW